MHVNEKRSKGSAYVRREERHATSVQNTVSKYTTGGSCNADAILHPYVRVELQRLTSRDEYLYQGQILQHIQMKKC